MPQEHKKRGRREGSKRKREQEDVGGSSSKLIKTDESDRTPARALDDLQASGVFFGLLEDQELTYFSNLAELLAADQFDNDDERDVFLNNSFVEIQGRELKIATCKSRLRPSAFEFPHEVVSPLLEYYLD